MWRVGPIEVEGVGDGNIDFLRCLAECDSACHPLPRELGERWARGQAIGETEQTLLVCPECDGPARPHVLWFDECYDETRFRFDSALAAARAALLFVVAGTSGSTNLPLAVVRIAANRRAPLLVVNRDPSPFSEVAEGLASGCFIQGAAGVVLPVLADVLLDSEYVGTAEVEA